ncbi:MAG: hypothetical protein MUE75_15145 [Algoriphagus sp.]|nr:hypothetical protein [Algoriphagus sp.]
MDDKHKIDIYSPCYEGSRFADHRFPLELVDDLLMLRNMTIEMAKALYIEKHSGRQRVPRNFTSGISIELESIEPGSTIPKLVLVSAMGGLLFPSPHLQYFQQAPERIKNAIEAAHLGQDFRQFVPDSVLNYFNNLGSNLRDDERIIFGDKQQSKAILDKESRKRLVMAVSKVKEYNKQFEIRGTITALDKERKTFDIQPVIGSKIKGEYSQEFLDELQDALFKMEVNQRIWLKGSGVFNASDKLQKIESISEAIPLDPLDVPSRLDEFLNLRDGWFDGEQGLSFDPNGLAWLGNTFDSNFNNEAFPLPASFPTLNGNVQFEWAINGYQLSLEVFLKEKQADFYAYNVQTKDEKEEKLDLSQNEGWIQLNKLMQEIHG